MNMLNVNNKDTRATSLTSSDNCIVNFEQISHLVLCSASAKKQLKLNIDRSLTVNFYTYREKLQCPEELLDLKIFFYSKVFLFSEVFCICDISILKENFIFRDIYTLKKDFTFKDIFIFMYFYSGVFFVNFELPMLTLSTY